MTFDERAIPFSVQHVFAEVATGEEGFPVRDVLPNVNVTLSGCRDDVDLAWPRGVAALPDLVEFVEDAQRRTTISISR